VKTAILIAATSGAVLNAVLIAVLFAMRREVQTAPHWRYLLAGLYLLFVLSCIALYMIVHYQPTDRVAFFYFVIMNVKALLFIRGYLLQRADLRIFHAKLDAANGGRRGSDSRID
jgi:hypothetical protein